MQRPLYGLRAGAWGCVARYVGAPGVRRAAEVLPERPRTSCSRRFGERGLTNPSRSLWIDDDDTLLAHREMRGAVILVRTRRDVVEWDREGFASIHDHGAREIGNLARHIAIDH